MALQVKVGSFAANTVTGDQSVTGIGFQPKAVIFMSADVASFGASAIHSEPIMGVAVSPSQQWAISAISQDAQTVTNTFRSASDSHCYYAGSFVAISMSFAFVSHDADGFTVNIDDAPTVAVEVGYIAIGGSGISVAAGVTSVPTAGATHAVTGVGFQPDVVLLGHIGRLTWPATNNTNFIFGLGAFTATDQVAFALSDRDAVADAQTNTYQRTDSCTIEVFADAAQSRTSRQSLDADGFTLSINTSPPAVSQPTGWLAIKGGDMKIGSDTQNTTTGTKSITGVGFRPQAVMIWGARQTVTTSVVNGGAYHALGAADGTYEFQMLGGTEDAVGTSDTARVAKDGACAGWVNGSAVTVSDATLASFDADGFTLDWTVADAVANQFLYWAFSEPPTYEDVLSPHLFVMTVA